VGHHPTIHGRTNLPASSFSAENVEDVSVPTPMAARDAGTNFWSATTMTIAERIFWLIILAHIWVFWRAYRGEPEVEPRDSERIT
jgi:hypothetical protein